MDQISNIRALVVDDEPLARTNLTLLLRLDPEVEIVGECSCGREALSEIRQKKPELVFLDVQMPECDGFDVLEILGSTRPAALVFVTAYDQYALRAFEAGALDYLLKPFDNARFDLALDRAKERIRTAKQASKMQDRLVIKNAGHVMFLNPSEIDWIEAADYYACLHVGPRTHLLRRSMSDLDRDLDQSIFCRIHRSTIVNLNRVQTLILNEVGEYDLLLNGGTKLGLSRRYRKELQSRLGLSHAKISERHRSAAAEYAGTTTNKHNTREG
jgi:two-component system, LytTR family, response regulator